MIRAIQRAIMAMPTAPSRVSTRVAVGIAIRCALEGACQGSRSCDRPCRCGARGRRARGGRLPPSLRSSGRHRPLRALAPCLPYREGIEPHSKEGVCPRARAPLSLRLACLIAPVQRDRAPHAIHKVTLCVPYPLAETPPFFGRADGAHYVRLRPRAPG